MIQADFQRTLSPYDRAVSQPSRWYFRLHIDPILVLLLTVVIVYGLAILRSAVDGNEALYTAQLQRFAMAYVVLESRGLLRSRSGCGACSSCGTWRAATPITGGR